MSTVPVRRYTAEEYLALERKSETKHQFYRGEIFAMTGASVSHNQIVLNLATAARTLLRGKTCRVFSNDLRVKAPSGLYTYPDMLIVCEELKLEDHHRDTLLNPSVIVEVLSPSTEAYDRGKKFEFYRSIQTIREYVLVAQDRMLVEHFVRQDDSLRWSMIEQRAPDDLLVLLDGGCQIALSEIYDLVEFDPPDDESTSAN